MAAPAALSIMHAFGLFRAGRLVGVVTYGCPANETQRSGLAGPHNRCWVLELNRLCLLDNQPHEASRLVGASLRLLKDDWIVLSYADRDGHGHTGTVYQACNFLYLGLTAKRKRWRVVDDQRHLLSLTDQHKRKVVGDYSLIDNIKMREGAKLYTDDRPRKHRYAFLLGPKQFKQQALDDLRYPVQQYPAE